jgi:ABC-type transporter Mla subunit MlaD
MGRLFRISFVFQTICGLMVLFASCSEETKKHIVIKFKKGDDLIEGALVKINGLDVGKIESVELNQNYEACASVKLEKDINIPKDSRFILDNESLFSTGVIVEPGNSNSYLQNNDTVKGIRPKYSKQDQIIEVFNELMENANFVKHQDSILKELKELNSHLEKSTALETPDTVLVE